MKQFYSLKQAASELHITRQRVYQLIRNQWKDKAIQYKDEYHAGMIWLIPATSTKMVKMSR